MTRNRRSGRGEIERWVTRGEGGEGGIDEGGRV